MPRATLNYLIDTGETPVTQTYGPGGRLRRRTGGKDDPREVDIVDGRGLATSLEREGFILADAPTRVVDFWDEDELRRVYYPETEALVRRMTGAQRAVVFDHTLRSGAAAEQEGKHAREPVQVVHNDYTEWSGPERLRVALPDEAEALLKRRFSIVQVWRPMQGPSLRDPLTLCDAQTLGDGDLIRAERRHLDRVGEIYQLAYNPAHRFVYFPRMVRDEAIVFVVYDSEKDGRARFTPHTSFADPTTPVDAPPRTSLELRLLALF